MTPSCYTGALWDAWMVDIHSCQLVRSSDQTCIIWQHLRSFIEILLKIFSCGFSLFFFFFLNKKKVVLLFAFFIFVKQFGALLIAIYRCLIIQKLIVLSTPNHHPVWIDCLVWLHTSTFVVTLLLCSLLKHRIASPSCLIHYSFQIDVKNIKKNRGIICTAGSHHCGFKVQKIFNYFLESFMYSSAGKKKQKNPPRNESE